jgi:uncharacterized protein (TIGR03083 family)
VGHDYAQLMWDETADLAEFVSGLPDAQWDHQSLCDGWRVRDVIGHMCVGHTESLGKILLEVARHKGDIDAGSAVASVEFASAHTPSELAEIFTGIARDHTRRGISRVIPAKAGFTDHLVHHQDIRRPLGQLREIPEHRLVAALDSLFTNLGGSMPSKKRLKGLKVTATDVGWTRGDGPEVRGPAEAIVLASLGRDVVLSDLEGDGAQRLRDTLAAAA